MIRLFLSGQKKKSNRKNKFHQINKRKKNLLLVTDVFQQSEEKETRHSHLRVRGESVVSWDGPLLAGTHSELQSEVDDVHSWMI